MLVLLDIDGTLLIDAARAHSASLRAAIHQVWELDAVPDVEVETAGMTDLAIARSILAHHEVDDDLIDERLEAFVEVAVAEYGRRVETDLSTHVAPGVPELLAGLAAREGWITTLLTGNLRPIAKLKLTAAGLGDPIDFTQGAYGSDAEERTALVPVARVRAGLPWPAGQTVVVGDTPRDIACARADGAHVVAVTTGPFDAAELTDADAVVADASGLLAAIDAL